MTAVALHPAALGLLREAEPGTPARQFIECEVTGPARFDVELVDGRVFMGCGMHGPGGPIRGHRAIERARAHTNGAVLVAWPVQLLTAYTARRSAVERVAASDVVSIEHARGLVTVLVGATVC